MALWAKVQQLPPGLVQQVTAIYGEHFPLEVRHVMANFIERHMWSEITPGHPEQEAYAGQAVAALLQEMSAKADSMTPNEFVMRMSLVTAADRFQDKFNGNPVALYKIIQKCLCLEMQVVNEASTAQGHGQNQATEITSALENVRKSVAETLDVLRQMAVEHDAYACQYHECTKHKAHIQTLAGKPMDRERSDKELHLKTVVSQLEASLSAMASGLLQAHLNLVDKLEKNIASLNILQCRVLDDELISWKREQQLCGNGAAMTRCLNTIQQWCENLADLIWQTRLQVKDTEKLEKKLQFTAANGMPGKLPHIEKQVDKLLTTLVTSMFVIEKQPPQVLKTSAKFSAKVRMLIGGQLNVFRNPPQVKVIIITEAQAQARVMKEQVGGAASSKQPVPEVCGDIGNNTASVEYKSATRELSVDFRNLQLHKIKRAEKKGTESVMDEKLTLLFQSQFNVGGELNYQVWTLSLPVVVIVHGVQEPHGWATVTWDNAFATPARIPFTVPDKVTWGQLAETLNLKFTYATGHPLSEENLRFLAQKMLRSTAPLNPGQLYTAPVSFSLFCKEPLPGRNFTFWEWLYKVMKVIKDHLRCPWTNGLIEGFIPKNLAENKLALCSLGTFLLRFSDSEPGAITIAWAGESQTEIGQQEVYSLQPFSSADLNQRGLGDRIADLVQLTWLYPDIPKDQAFGKYYTASEHNLNSHVPYVKTIMTMQLPQFNQHYSLSNASSPLYSIRSPDSQRDTPSANSNYGASPLPRYAATPAAQDAEYKCEYNEQADSMDQCEFEQLSSFDIGTVLLQNGLMSRSQH